MVEKLKVLIEKSSEEMKTLFTEEVIQKVEGKARDNTIIVVNRVSSLKRGSCCMNCLNHGKFHKIVFENEDDLDEEELEDALFPVHYCPKLKIDVRASDICPDYKIEVIQYKKSHEVYVVFNNMDENTHKYIITSIEYSSSSFRYFKEVEPLLNELDKVCKKRVEIDTTADKKIIERIYYDLTPDLTSESLNLIKKIQDFVEDYLQNKRKEERKNKQKN
jgi:hypothetical protein